MYNQLTSKDYALKNADGEVISIGYCLETYGIIVNKALLKEAGYEAVSYTHLSRMRRRSVSRLRHTPQPSHRHRGDASRHSHDQLL